MSITNVSVIEAMDYNIPYDDMISMCNKGVLSLGIDDAFASVITDRKMVPSKSIYAVFMLCNLLIIVLFIYFAYRSFVDRWWWSILGALVVGAIFKGSRKGNSQNIVDFAMRNKDFYTEGLSKGYWLYQVNSELLVDIKARYHLSKN